MQTQTPSPKPPRPGTRSNLLAARNVELSAQVESLQASGEVFRQIAAVLQNVRLAAVMLDRDARITYCNDYLLELSGWEREEVMGRDWFEVFMPVQLGDMKPVFLALLENMPEAWHRDNEIFTRSGERRMVRWNNSVLRSPAGDIVGIASIGEDVTDSIKAQGRVAHLNRVYAMLSGITSLIVRVRDRHELFREACRIAVQEGQLRMAWIGIVDAAGSRIVPVASYGARPDMLARAADCLPLPMNDTSGETLAVRAIRGAKALVSNDLQHDPVLQLAEAHEARCAAMLPLVVAGEAVGVMALYADRAGFFDDEELALLTELASDIAFAIDHIDKRARLDYIAFYDPLTGLANRTLFQDRLAIHMRSAASRKHRLALFLVDVERFKNINDSLGWAAGDALLKQVGDWLARGAGDVQLVARLGADHFAVVLPHIDETGHVASLVEKRVAAFLEHPFELDGAVFRLGAKLGIAVFPEDGEDAGTLFKNAEAALKKAKAGREPYLFHTRTMTESVAGTLTLENRLRSAVENAEFVLHYQPKVSLTTGKLVGGEALIRWNDPRGGLVAPGRFIPILEETGLIYEVGRWALRKAIEDQLRWRAAGLSPRRIAVNVSPLQLRNRGFVREISDVVTGDARDAAGLELEITESVLMEDAKRSIATLEAIREMGVTVAIDDFGTGFSSLSYLSRMRVDTLKIDRSFVSDMPASREGLALVSTIINLAHSLSLNVVAEGVETEEQARLLRLVACDDMQGFLIGRPVPAADFEKLFLQGLDHAA